MILQDAARRYAALLPYLDEEEAPGETPVSAALVLPYESLLTLAPSLARPWENLAGVLATRAAPWEDVHALVTTAAGPWEALLAVLATGQSPSENLLGVLASGIAPFEVLGLLLVAQTATVAWEDVAAILGGPVTGVWEALAALAAARATPAENLAAAAQGRAGVWEALQGLVVPSGLLAEQMAGLRGLVIAPWEEWSPIPVAVNLSGKLIQLRADQTPVRLRRSERGRG